MLGKYCFEVTLVDNGLCRVGWATATATLALGTDGQGFGYGSTGKKSFASKFEDYGQPYGAGDTITCTLDTTDGSIAFFKNGASAARRPPPRAQPSLTDAPRSFHGLDPTGAPLGVAFKVPPAMKATPFFPAVLIKNAEVQVNLGQRPLVAAAATAAGYVPVAQAAPDKRRTAQQIFEASGAKTAKCVRGVLHPCLSHRHSPPCVPRHDAGWPPAGAPRWRSSWSRAATWRSRHSTS